MKNSLIKNFAIASVIVVVAIGGLYYKNNMIERGLEAELDKLTAENFFEYDRVKCGGLFDIDCKIQKVNLTIQTQDSKDKIFLDFIKIYSIQDYLDLDNKIENKDIKIKADFIGFNLEKKHFLEGIEDEFLKDLMLDLYNSVNKFDIHSQFVINISSKDKGVLSKFDLQKLNIQTKNFSVDTNMFIKDLSIENAKDSILQNFNGIIQNQNIESIFIKWLNNMKKNYPDIYKEACEAVDLNPQTTKALRVFGKLRKLFAMELTAQGIENASSKYQKDYNLALKALIEGKSKTIGVLLKNKTNISFSDFITGTMMAMISKEGLNQYMFDNFDLEIHSK